MTFDQLQMFKVTGSFGSGQGHSVTQARKQSFWDRPGILASRVVVESSISDSVQMATFLAASAPHSEDWLLALSVSSCGFRLCDDAVRVAVSLRLGCSICVAHILADTEPWWMFKGNTA